ncbi:MAG: hypothetical protein Q9N68_10835, partial [Gammaproteobacteria bacterium]|nr:hypothetical protein [Gammaproteobacteria bacterium]
MSILVLFMALLVLLGQQPEGARWLLREMIPLADTAPENSPFTVKRIEGHFPQDIILRGVSLRDEQGEWLLAERVRLQWSPWVLLRGDLKLLKVLAEEVQLMRLPQAGTTSAKTKTRLPQLPQLPFGVQLDRLSLKNIQLAEAVLGQAAVLDIDAQLVYQNGQNVQALFSLVRQDRRGEAYQLVLNWQRNVGLQSDLNVVSPEGGLLSHLIHPDAPAMQLHLSGRGPLSEWQAELHSSVVGWGELEGAVQADVRLPQQLKMQFSARPGEKVPVQYRALLGEHLALALDVAYDWHSPLVLRQFELQTAVADLSLNGVLSPQLQLSKTDLQLRIKQPKLMQPWLEGVKVQQAVLKAQLHGALTEPKIAAQLRLKDLLLDKIALFPSLWLDAQADLARLDSIKLELRGAEARFESAELQALLAGELVLSLEAALKQNNKQVQLKKLRFTSSALNVTGKGESSMNGQRSELSLRATLDEIEPLAAGLDFPAAGQLHLDLHGHLEGSHYVLSVASELQKLALQSAPLQQLLGSEVKLQLEGRGDLGGELRLTQLQLRAQRLALQASGKLTSDQNLKAEVDLVLDDLNPLAAELSGAALLSAELGGSVQRPSLNFKLKSKTLNWQQHQFDDLQGQFTFSSLLGKGRGKLSLKSGGSLGAILLSGDLQRSAEGDLTLNQLSLQATDLNLRGEMKVPASGLPLVGKLHLKMPSMRLIKSLSESELALQGRAELDLALSAKGKEQNLQLDLRSSELQFEQHGVQNLHLSADLHDLMAKKELTLSLRAKQLRSGLLQQTDVALDVAGREDQYTVEGRLVGQLPGRLELAFSSRLDLDEPSVQLTSLHGWLAEQKLLLLQPSKIALGDNVGWKNLSLSLGEGRLDSALQLQARALTLSLGIKQVPLAVIRLLLPDQAWSGQLNAQVRLHSQAK